MGQNKEIQRVEASAWTLPLWLKMIAAVFPPAWLAVFLRAQVIEQTRLLGLSREYVVVLSIVLFVLSLIIAVAFWCYPASAFSRLLYWTLCFFGDHISVLASLGIVFLLTIRAPVFSLRGGVLYLSLLVIFVIGLWLKPVGIRNIPHPSFERFFNFIGQVTQGIGVSRTVVWKGIVVLLPVAIVLMVIYGVFGAKMSDYGPYSFWNDEVAYWVWLRSFSFVGFQSGYNAPNEILAPFDFSRYGEASPFYLYVYGSIAHITGWSSTLPIWINFLLISLSIFIFIRFIKLDTWQIIFTGLAITLSWPVLLFLPLTTHETLNQAFGIIFAFIIIKLIANISEISLGLKWFFVFLVYFATFVRLSWGLLLFPILFYCIEGSLLRRGLLSIIGGACLYISAIVAMGYLLPPLNNSIFDTFRGGLLNGPQIFLDGVRRQIFFMFRFKELNPNIGVTFQMLVIMAWSIARLSKLLQVKPSLDSITRDFDFINFYNLAALLIAGFIFYLQEGFYRVFAPVLLIVYLIQIFRRDFRRLSVLLMVNLIFLSSYMNFYAHVGDFQIVRADYTSEYPQRERIQAEIEKFVAYDPNAENPWCNTLLIPLAFYDSRLILFPPGIGVSYILDSQNFKLPIKSRYILFDLDTYETYRDQVNIRLQASLPDDLGNLYENMDIDCPSVRK